VVPPVARDAINGVCGHWWRQAAIDVPCGADDLATLKLKTQAVTQTHRTVLQNMQIESLPTVHFRMGITEPQAATSKQQIILLQYPFRFGRHIVNG